MGDACNGNDVRVGERCSTLLNAVLDAVYDDLNIPKALGAVWEMVRDKKLDAQEKAIALRECDTILGLDLMKTARARKVKEFAQQDGSLVRIVTYREVSDQEISETVDALRRRMSARRQKDFTTADQIRDELAAQGKKMRDLPGNTSECALF